MACWKVSALRNLDLDHTIATQKWVILLTPPGRNALELNETNAEALLVNQSETDVK